MPVRHFKFDNSDQKAAYVQQMFDNIAPRYDLMNRLMTFGRDQSWRRLLIKRAGIQPGARVLDIATGTGDIALAASLAGAQMVVAADFSQQMLLHASQKFVSQNHRNGRKLMLASADGLALPFPDNTFDAVVTGFSLRNVGNLDTFLREMARVKKFGGKVACLEIIRPRSRHFRDFFSWY